MDAIFISYRRDDAEGQAGRLFDDLIQHFGENGVFMDVADIEPGRDFRRVIDEQVASCGVLLAIIGKSWLTAQDDRGERRLDDQMDFVRIETASALKRDIPVVPVLVHGAKMPSAEDLPDDLKELAFRNAVELTHARWDSDVQVLVKALQPYIQVEAKATDSSKPTVPVETPVRKKSSRKAVAIWVTLSIVALGGFILLQESSDVAMTGAEVSERSNGMAIAEEGMAKGGVNQVNREQFVPDEPPVEDANATADHGNGDLVTIPATEQDQANSGEVPTPQQTDANGNWQEGDGSVVNAGDSDPIATVGESSPVVDAGGSDPGAEAGAGDLGR